MYTKRAAPKPKISGIRRIRTQSFDRKIATAEKESCIPAGLPMADLQ